MTEPINLCAPDVRRNPYPIYARLRDAPVQQVEPGGFWAVSRHEDAEHVLKNPEVFSSAGFEALLKPSWLPHNPVADSILTKDGPAHAKLRAVVSRVFAPRAVARLDRDARRGGFRLRVRRPVHGPRDRRDPRRRCRAHRRAQGMDAPALDGLARPSGRRPRERRPRDGEQDGGHPEGGRRRPAARARGRYGERHRPRRDRRERPDRRGDHRLPVPALARGLRDHAAPPLRHPCPSGSTRSEREAAGAPPERAGWARRTG